METIIQEEGKILTVVFKGRLDSFTAPEAETQLLPMIEENNYETIVFDCSELNYIASSGLRLFFSAMKISRSQGGRVTLKGVNDFVRSVLVSTGLAAMFEFEK